MATIRRAHIGDLDSIGAVLSDVWEERLLVDTASTALDDGLASIWVAEQGDLVVGFASGFQTVGLDDVPRWEVDLLAVLPEYQCLGLGRGLIEAIWADGLALNAAYARALLRADNLPAQRAFAAAGYTSDRRKYQLFLWSPVDADEPGMQIPLGVGLVPVDTLTYRGLWIEGLEPQRMGPDTQRAVVEAARVQAGREDRFNTGALIPAAQERFLAPDLRTIAALQGTYHWWVRR